MMETCDKIFSSGVVLMKNGLRSSSISDPSGVVLMKNGLRSSSISEGKKGKGC